jgi:hypothetical protein
MLVVQADSVLFDVLSKEGLGLASSRMRKGCNDRRQYSAIDYVDR